MLRLSGSVVLLAYCNFGENVQFQVFQVYFKGPGPVRLRDLTRRVTRDCNSSLWKAELKNAVVLHVVLHTTTD